jgi:hypothetical protein
MTAFLHHEFALPTAKFQYFLLPADFDLERLNDKLCPPRNRISLTIHGLLVLCITGSFFYQEHLDFLETG